MRWRSAASTAWAATDRVAAVLPLYHINAFAVTMLAPLAHGGSLVMPPKFSAAGFWEMATRHGCTWLNVVPTIISYLLEGEAPARELLPRIRFCRSASAALPPEHHRAFEAKFGIGIVETMGLTETVAPAFSNPIEPQLRKIGSVGRASGCEARVVDAAGAPLADGTVGEIVIRGPQVTPGYYKNAEATAAAFFPGQWLRTGDLGYRDDDGFFFVTGRIKELIIKGGENIAPREIDEALVAASGGARRRGGRDSRSALRAGDHGVRGRARWPALLGTGTSGFLQPRARAIQDAEDDPLRRRSAARPFGQGAAPQACRSCVHRCVKRLPVINRLPRLPISRWLPELRKPATVRADALCRTYGCDRRAATGRCIRDTRRHAARIWPVRRDGAVHRCGAVRFEPLDGDRTGHRDFADDVGAVAPLATPGSPRFIALVLTLTFLVGALQLALGLARAGRLIDFVPHSVIVGFTAGAAILIINSQIGPFLGLGLPRGTSVIDNVRAAVANWPNINPAAPLIGTLTIGVVLAWQPLNRWVPAMLVECYCRLGRCVAARTASAAVASVADGRSTSRCVAASVDARFVARHDSNAVRRNHGDDTARVD